MKSELLESTRQVFANINALEKVLHVQEMHQNGGLRAKPHELRQTWVRFKHSLEETGDVIQAPEPGQGLASLWLRYVCREAASAEVAIRQYGWEEIVFHNHDNLFRLVTTCRQVGFSLLRFLESCNRGLISLLEPNSLPSEKLRSLAEEWAASETDPARGMAQPLNSDYPRRAGELVLEAINALEVKAEYLKDETFSGHVLGNLDVPASLAGRLGATSDRELNQVVAKLMLVPDGPGSPALAAYPAHLYARDKWIYEHISSHCRKSLKLALKPVANQNGWQIISTPNGLKKSADRYATFHNLPPRRFGPRTND